MAFTPQFNYSPPGSAPLQSPQLVLPGKAAHTPETARTLLHDACNSQGVCTCPVGSSVPYLTRVASIADSVYSQAAMTPTGMGVEPSAFYPLGAAGQSLGLEARQAADLWKGLQQHSPVMYPFDPMMAVHPYSTFYGNLDLNNAARRKNATRETTSALKAWLYEHRKNPYPTKGEKIMLAIITKMTLTQVSTWFANARRRLKKESKLSWSNKDKDFDDSDIDCDELNDKSMDDSSDIMEKSRIGSTSTMSRDLDDDEDIKVTSDLSDISDAEDDNQRESSRLSPEPEDKQSTNQRKENQSTSPSTSTAQSQQPQQNNSPQITSKPKIWSIAEIMNNDSNKEKINIVSPLPNVVSPRHGSDNVHVLHNSRNIYNGLRLMNREALMQSLVPSHPHIARNVTDTALNLTVIDKKSPITTTTTTEASNQTVSPKSC